MDAVRILDRFGNVICFCKFIGGLLQNVPGFCKCTVVAANADGNLVEIGHLVQFSVVPMGCAQP